MAHNAPAVLVIGTPRSGTSLMMQILERAGLDVGYPVERYGPTEFNERGLYELPALNKLNDKIMRSWQDEDGIVRNLNDVDKNLNEDIRTFTSAWETRRPYALKDPRWSWTMPAFLPHISNRKIVWCVRNPMEVNDSAARIARSMGDTSNGRYGYVISYAYHNRIMEWLPGEDYAVVLYDEIFDAPQAVAKRLNGLIDPPTALTPNVLRDAADPSLRHNKRSVSEWMASDDPEHEKRTWQRVIRLWETQSH